MAKLRIKRFLLLGLTALLPTVASAYIVYRIVALINHLIGKPMYSLLIGSLPQQPSPVMGFALWAGCLAAGVFAVLAILFVSGFLLTSYIGEFIFRRFDRTLSSFPLLRVIYPAVKQVTNFFLQQDKRSFERVVAVEYPRRGVFSIGFLTGEGLKTLDAAGGRKRVNVLIPSVPTPFSGYLVFVPEDELIPLAISVDEAFKLFMSCGVILPESQLRALTGEASGDAKAQT